MDKVNMEPGKEILFEKLHDALLDTFYPGHTFRQIFSYKIKMRRIVHVRKQLRQRQAKPLKLCAVMFAEYHVHLLKNRLQIC